MTCPLIAAFLFLAVAEGTQAAESSTTLTIYSKAGPGAVPPELYRPGAAPVGYSPQPASVPGYAIIKEERPIDLDGERTTIRYTDVASQIDPTTVAFISLTDPDTTHVIEQNYEFDLVSASKLMERYIDHEITVEQAHGESIETFTGKLLSTIGGLVLQSPDGQVKIINGYSNVAFPELPGGLITRPTLVWDVVTGKPGRHNTRVTYETGGITWWADYNAVFSEGADANSGVLELGAWVSIINRSGATYRDAKLKLIAGDVHRAPQQIQRRAYAMEMAGGARLGQAKGFEEKSFFEYHLYTLGRPTTLPDNSTKQIELFPTASGVPCDKVLVYYGQAQRFGGYYGNPMTDRNFGVQSNSKVDIYLRFKNSKDRGLGMPLPAGRIRISKLDTADDTLEFIGEDSIDHTPRNEELLLKLGSAFDVVGERKQADFKINKNRHWIDEVIEIKVRNRKEEPVEVIIKETLYRWVNWKITQKTQDYEKMDSRTIHFPVRIPADGEVTVRYTVHYSW